MRSLVYFNPRRNPLTTRELFSEFDSFFNDFSPTKAWANDESKTFAMGSAVEETDKAYLLSVDLPGVKPEDIQLDIDKNRVQIRAERKKEVRTESGMQTKSYGQYSESFTIPDDVNSENIEAHFENGVLTLALPKELKTQKKTIQVQHGQESKGLLERWFSKNETPTEKKIN